MSVYTSLRELIVDGRLPGDRRIAEAEISALLDVSRTPVREALSRLEGDGLVLASGRGVRIRTLDPEQLRGVLEARAGLESWAAGRAAGLVAEGVIAPVRLQTLERLADSADQSTRAGDIVAAILANREFHLAIAEMADNPVVVETLRSWWDQIIVATRSGLHAEPRIEAVDEEHREILAGLIAGDSARTRAAVEAHATQTLRVIEELQR